MAQYIDKSAVVAEIERRYEINLIGAHGAFRNGKIEALREMKDFLNTLEAKEVDLGAEFDNYIEKQNAFIDDDSSEIKYYNGDSFNHTYDIYPVAKHFFELGRSNARKEE